MRIIAFLAFFSMLAALAFAAAPPEDTAAKTRVQGLIRQLGSSDFGGREEATRKLLELEDAEPALQCALVSTTDAEVLRRLRTILAGLARRRMQKMLVSIQSDAKHGRADMLAERLVRWRGPDDDPATWQAVLDLGRKLQALEQKQFKRVWDWRPHESEFLAAGFAKYHWRYSVQALAAGRPVLDVKKPKVITGPRLAYLARGEQVTIEEAHTSLISASENASFGSVNSSVIFCSGSVNIKNGSYLIIVCDGDLSVEKILGASIVIVRGSLRCSAALIRSVVLVGGDVTLTERTLARNCTIRSTGAVVLQNKAHFVESDVKDNDKDALTLVPISFFATSSVGVQVAVAKEGVRVTAAPAGKPFARAGLVVNDVVLSLDGTVVKDAEAFRRLLRKRVVEGKATLKVKRGDKVVTIQVPLP